MPAHWSSLQACGRWGGYPGRMLCSASAAALVLHVMACEAVQPGQQEPGDTAASCMHVKHTLYVV